MLGTGTLKSLYEKLCCTGAGKMLVVVIAILVSPEMFHLVILGLTKPTLRLGRTTFPICVQMCVVGEVTIAP
jgi:hypothetical protein